MSTILTREGYNKLVQELKKLKEIDRPAVIERIKNARELGDLSENADYASAREQQSFIEGKIKEIEEKIKNSEIIDSSKINSAVALGHKIELDCNGALEKYELVGDTESDPINGKISVNSPIGRAILGKKIGEIVKIQVPSGIKECKILKIN